MNNNKLSLLPCFVLLACSAVAKEPLSFQQDVRPILSDKCFRCHGPDANNQESDFRIDTFDDATTDLGGYAGVVPNNVEESEVHVRIHADDPELLMPPPDAKMTLTEKEKATLDQWISEGGQYEKHWSLTELPKAVTVPDVAQADLTNPIDRFIVDRLQAEGLQLSPETSREKWLRRVTFDLTGLPPTADEIERFLSDRSDEAYKKVVDRLLGSTGYAERMATEWLDVARYSDTFGYQVDRNRRVWPWRDWVIRAFEDNLPYDEFVTWQLAGDQLDNPTRDQLLATTFNRLHSQKAEGGSIEEEFRIEYVADRVNTFGTAFLGLTFECTRCHDHKYDPITQRDYFSLSAFFANIDEAGLYSYFDSDATPTPALDLPREGQQKVLDKAVANVQRQLESIQAMNDQTRKDFEAWFAKSKPSISKVSGGEVVHLDFEPTPDDKYVSRINEDHKAKRSRNSVVEGKIGKGVKMTGDHAIQLPDGPGNFNRDEAFSFGIWINAPVQYDRAVVVRRAKGWTDSASRGYELLIEDGRLSAALVHFWPGNAIRIRSVDPVPTKSWHHVTWTYDGSSKAAGLKLYLDGQLCATEVVRDGLTRRITEAGKDAKKVGLGARNRDRGFKNGLIDEFRIFDRELSPVEALALSGSNEEPSTEQWYAHYRLNIHKPTIGQAKTLRDAYAKRSAAQDAIPQIMTMREKSGQPRKAHLLGRGSYDSPGEEVRPATPAVLPELMTDKKRPSRLDLARWLIDPNHPLTARVAVNRYWQMLFGKGLVSTSEDFGAQGQPPSHPELLDWLARDFVDSGWNLHHLIKQIVLSATYRQSSNVTEYLRENDPENVLLARAPANPLTAEMLRDNALAVAGLLSRRVGGGPVKPYDLEFSFVSRGKISPDKGEGLYRRSLYTYWKRTGPSPLMMTLDAAKRDVCTVRRERTSSPLQALVLLNSPQFVEASRVLGEKLLKPYQSDDGKSFDPDFEMVLKKAFEALTSRYPNEAESVVLRRLLKSQLEYYRANPVDAEDLLKVGNTAVDSRLPQAELAATTATISTLMNFDECLLKR